MRLFHSVPLRERFLLLLLPVVVGAPVVIGLVGQSLLSQHFDEEVESDLSSRMLSQVLPLSARLETLRHELRVLALSPGDGGDSAREAHGAMLLARSPELSEVFFVLPHGDGRQLIRCTREGLLRETAIDPGSAPWAWPESHADAAAEGFQLDRAGSATEDRLWAVEPIASAPGVYVGMFVRSSIFADHLEPLRDRDGAYALMISTEGEVLYSSDDGYTPHGSIFDAEAPCAAHVGEGLLGPDPVALCPHDNAQLIVASHRLPDLHMVAGYVVPHAVVTADQALFGRVLWSIIGGTALVAVLIISLLAGWISRPIRDLSLGMESVAKGDLDRRVDAAGDDEVARLAQSFNAMVSDLQSTQVALRSQSRQLEVALREVESVDAMKDSFLALVSHEVRTPLTSIMGGIEFLKDDHFGERDETEVEFMNIIYESCQRLAGFMNDAILMASLQAQRGKDGFEEFSLSRLVLQSLQEHEELAQRQEVDTGCGLTGSGELFLQGDWTLMQVALRKTLHNAYWHNRPEGRVQVDVVDRVQEDGTPVSELVPGAQRFLRGERAWRALRVFNTGPIIPADKIDSLFRRFELTHDIENHQRGSGLSLPIVRYVMELHEGTVALREAGEGMAFYLVLPLRQSDTPVKMEAMDLDGMDETVAAAHLLEVVQAEVEEVDRDPDETSDPEPTTAAPETEDLPVR